VETPSSRSNPDTSAQPGRDALPTETAPVTEASVTTPAAHSAEWKHLPVGGGMRRVIQRVLGLVAVLVAVAVVTLMSIDIGPWLRARAEQAASRYLDREVRIGELSARLLQGRFLVRDITIGGLRPGDRPFFTAGRVTVGVPWWTILRREVVIEAVDLTDWNMLVEMFPDGRHNFPRFIRQSDARGTRRFTTTLRLFRGSRGQFTYLDHGASWSIVAPNMRLAVARTDEYRGEASFEGATIRIGRFEPMTGRMRSRFTIKGGEVVFDRIDLDSDGATSLVTGKANFAKWPEQQYIVRSKVDFPRMREIFFAHDRFTLGGQGEFVGTFRLFKGGRELKGRFASLEARVNDWRFAGLDGFLLWVKDRFEVTRAVSGFYGGWTSFDYSMKPLGDRQVPAMARLDARYEGVDLPTLVAARTIDGLRLQGRASGRTLLEWPLGRFKEKHGEGVLTVDPPPGVALQGAVLSQPRETSAASVSALPPVFDSAVGASLSYTFGPEWIAFNPGWVATPRTHVALKGRTAYGDRSDFAFSVASADWQESDRLLAGVMTALGNPTNAIDVGGSGTFEGTMIGSFLRPRVAGKFATDGIRAWNVDWGRATGGVVVENGYADVTGASVTRGDSTLSVDGRFSLGFPRRDGGEEINARVRMDRRPLSDLRHAFDLDRYPLEGLVSGEFRINGRYLRPFGFGRARIDGGSAYGERFEEATANLRFEGEGVRLDAIEMRKATGHLTGAAYVSWEGAYSFNADGRHVPLDRLDALMSSNTVLSGALDFSASGSGTFADPRYEVRGQVPDLFVRDEQVGHVTGRFSVRGDELTIAQLEAASPRLTLSGAGRVMLTPQRDADLTLRLTKTSIDPYVRMVQPQVSPHTTAIASGTIHLVGPLADRSGVRGNASIEEIDLQLFDYRLRNDGPILVSLEGGVARVERLRVVGEATTLELFGELDVTSERMRIRALGDANLGILQGIFRDVRSSGAAEVQAELGGSFHNPVLIGSALISDGRFRSLGLPHSIEAVNGRVEFDKGGVRLDGLSGRMGGGEVRFGGRIGVEKGRIDTYAVTASGRDMRVRYPEGFRSLVDVDLTLSGDAKDPLLSGTVKVKDAVWTKSFDTEGAGIFGLAAAETSAPPPAADNAFPLRLDLRVDAPSSLRLDTPTARLRSSAELTVRGTYGKPALLGRADIERGEVLLEGNRYVVTRGAVEFANPSKIEPVFDVEAETRARVPGQTYRVTFRASGTRDRFTWDFASDPPLATVDILALLFGDLRDPRDAELSALRLRDRTEEELLVARATRLLANPLSSEVGKVVRKTFGVDTVQITPSLGDLSTLQSARLNPTARLTIGKRISERLFLTYAQPLTSSRPEQLLLVEFTQNDRLAWIVSRNEDETFALDVRVRHIF
jgi:TamB, inner membrane protein subunit of TAM complex